MANFPPTSAPQFEKWERLADTYPIVRGPEYADGGRDTFLSGTTPTRRWRVTYRGLTTAEALILDNWYADNFGEHGAFTFTDRDGVAYGFVKCVRYERGHEGMYAYGQFREIEFEDRP